MISQEKQHEWGRPHVESKLSVWSLRAVAAIAPTLALCVATASAQKIYWTDYTKIQRSDPDGSNIEDVLAANGIYRPIAMALDINGGKMYWVSEIGPKIRRADLDGSHREELVTVGLTKPYGIALDLVARKMYWADGDIQRADLDGTGIETLVVEETNVPVGIALDVPAGKMYWTDWNTDKILRANLDGSEVEDLVATGNVPNGIVLDLAARKMYWTDETGTISRADLDGSNVEDIIIQGTFNPMGIALDPTEGKLYWVNDGYLNERIQRANVDGSDIEDVVVGGMSSPWGIAIDAVARKMYWTDTGPDTIKRADLTGSNIEDLFKREVEAPRTIRLDASTGMIYWYDDHVSHHGPARIRRANFDGSDIVDLVSSCLTKATLSLDPLRDRLYWLRDCDLDTVVSSDLDGSNVEDVATKRIFDNYLTTVAVDAVGGKVYYAADVYNRLQAIRRANLDGSEVENLINHLNVLEITIDSWARKMYWTELPLFPDYVAKIRRANLDGSQAEILVSAELFWPWAIIVEPSEGKMYWTDAGLGKIQRANLDGTQVEDLVSGLLGPMGIALDLCGRDGPVTLPDHALFVDCMTGPATLRSTDCVCADLKGDGRADLVDYAIFQKALAHP